MKIFTTQIAGHFNRILEQEEMNIEDSARLLAQALVGDGKVYLYGHKELHGVVLEALTGSESLVGAESLLDSEGAIKKVTSADRVILFTYLSTDEEAITIAKELSEKGIQTVGVSALIKNTVDGLNQNTDLHIDAKLRQPLIPGDDGERYGYPALMTALYVYYALSFTIKEILNEYEED